MLICGPTRHCTRRAKKRRAGELVRFGPKPMNANLSFAALLLIATASWANDAEEDPCNKDYHLAQVQCLGKKIQAAEVELDKQFKATVAQLPDSDPSDNRKGKEQLRKAQEAWRHYRDEHCAFIGGIQGGSNLWVSHFAGDCELEEINKRIEFFKNVPWVTTRPNSYEAPFCQ